MRTPAPNVRTPPSVIVAAAALAIALAALVAGGGCKDDAPTDGGGAGEAQDDGRESPTVAQVEAAGDGGGAPEREAARLVVRYLEDEDPALLVAAREKLGTFATDRMYPAHLEFLHRLVDWLRRPEGERDAAAPTPLYRAVLRKAAADDGALAKHVLGVFFLGKREANDLNTFDAFARELVVCSFPGRRKTEDTDETVRFMGLKPGDRVADVGSGPGYFTFPFAEAVGPEGKAYAIEVNDWMLKFVQSVVEERGIGNLAVVRGEDRDITLPEGALDHAFMTHMFVDIDIHYDREHRHALFGSILRALRPGGMFTVCEPYAPGRRNMTADELVARLEEYGFADDKRQAPDSPIASFNCVRVKRPQPAE